MPNQISYYTLLGLHPTATAIEIRRAYRELSKRYHPDTTDLQSAIATAKFQQLNEAYATLSNPERRLTYDLKIGYSRLSVIQAPPDLNHPTQCQRRAKPSHLLSAFFVGLRARIYDSIRPVRLIAPIAHTYAKASISNY